MSDYPDSASITLVRHGETEWSASGRHTGRTDVALTPRGEQQAEDAGEALAHRHFARVLTSPLVRASRTAALAGYPDAEICPELVEWDYGPFEGRTTPDISAELGRPWTIWNAGDDGGAAPAETAAEVGRRADQMFERLDAVLAAGDQALVFAHSHVLRIVAARWLRLAADEGARFILGTGSISELGFEHGTRVIAHWNAMPHLDVD